MDSRAIKVGDLVEVDVRGLVFKATVEAKQPHNLAVYPVDPIRSSFRHVSSRQVKRVIERRGAGEVDA